MAHPTWEIKMEIRRAGSFLKRKIESEGSCSHELWSVMKFWLTLLSIAPLFWCAAVSAQERKQPTLATPLIVVAEAKEVRVAGSIYPERFNTAQGEEAHYHLLVWQGGTSPFALIETPADDLAFYEALTQIGGKPGNNLTMAAWTERHDRHSTAPHAKVTGSALKVRIAWQDNPSGIPIEQAFRQHPTPNTQHPIQWRFGGNRNRWFNRIPLAPRPGCLVCLYSCPSGKVSNSALSIHDYVTLPSRFSADTGILPADGTSVLVTFHLRP
jgi:hypothetical protein